MRGGKTADVSVAVATMPANPDADFTTGGPSGPVAPVPGHGALGLTLAPITPDASNALNLSPGATGAVVTAVKANSPADQAGLEPGDLLVGVGAQAVNNPGDAVTDIAAARKSGASAVALRIIRQGQPLFVGIALKKTDAG